jgi:hypothetical protein
MPGLLNLRAQILRPLQHLRGCLFVHSEPSLWKPGDQQSTGKRSRPPLSARFGFAG